MKSSKGIENDLGGDILQSWVGTGGQGKDQLGNTYIFQGQRFFFRYGRAENVAAF